jgi:phage terminase large subunit-like protein
MDEQLPLPPSSEPIPTPVLEPEKPDRFRDAVREIHRIRRLAASLDPKARAAFIKAAPGAEQSFVFKAHDFQLIPENVGSYHLWLAGRAAGKTYTLSNVLHLGAACGIKRMVLVAANMDDARDINIKGPAGVLQTAPVNAVPRWVETHRVLKWENGCEALVVSAETPEAFRGLEIGLAACDEFGKYTRGLDVFENLRLALRASDHPRAFFSTTPRANIWMRKLLDIPGLTVNHATTLQNAANLPEAYLKDILNLYDGTTVVRREIYAEMIWDVSDQIFCDDWFRIGTVDPNTYELVVTSVDPSGGKDYAGIITAARCENGEYHVIADDTVKGTSGEWGRAAVLAHDRHGATEIIVERNFGGDQCRETIRRAAEDLAARGEREDSFIRIKEVHASQGKIVRADPVSLVYQRGRVIHAPGLAKLEAEQMQFTRSWSRERSDSPNRVDALCHAINRLSSLIMSIPMA